MKKLFVACIAISSLFPLSVSAQKYKGFVEIKPTDTPSDIIKKAANVVPTDRQLRWQNLELTAFIHFGMNTFTGREWGKGNEDPKLFNPTHLDTDQWVTVLKNAGFKQIILTAKHHDGFCLWPTKTTEHSVKNSPWENGSGDVVRLLSESCKKQNIGFGIYLSPWDMNAPSYGTDDYNTSFENQLTELLTQYGRIDEVWFDGANGEGPNGKKQEYDFNSWYKLIRKLQPSAVIAIMGPDVRWVGTESGKGREQEWSVVPGNNLDQQSISKLSQNDVIFKPAEDLRGQILGDRNEILKASSLVWYPAETDVSIQDGWFYHKNHSVKSAQKLHEIYYTSVGMNSVLLLNIPPDTRGLISDQEVKVLSDWAKLRNGIFSNNLLKNSKAYSKYFSALKKLTDGKNKTQARTATHAASVEFKLKIPQKFNVLMLQENIAKGQRIEKFSAHYFDGNSWKKFAEGTTVGHKRLIRTESIRADRVRIDIEQSRMEPNLSEAGLFFDPTSK